MHDALCGPDVRLAYHPEGGRTLSELGTSPAGRLALADGQAERNGTIDKPDVRFAATSAMLNDSAHSGKHRYPHHRERKDGGELLAPALLVSYVYLKPFLANRHRYHYRDWVMDSGAYSALNSGTEISIHGYIETCKHLMMSDPLLVEVYSLDVIGDWRAGERNTQKMWAKGVEAIPCYHVGEPESVLLGMAKYYPKIALGGAVGLAEKVKIKWASDCFAKVWPKKIHGFGFGGEKAVMTLPFHSVDATNWELGPCKFGRWQCFGKMSVRGSKQNLRAEVMYYLDLERRARDRWSKEMRILEDIGPAVRLDHKVSGREESLS